MTEETLFHEALAKPAAERAAFLERACAGKPELRAAVEALLAEHEAPGGFLDEPAAAEIADLLNLARPEAAETRDSPAASPIAAHPPLVRPGGVIAGRYALREKIGEGGMGKVWVANQTDPVKRKVALKLIKPGMDSRAVLQRFEQERQALALMDHPHIAKVLDGGLTPSGQPFFVMELVNGLPLTHFCDEARLTPRERLELFVPICQAVQHAHQKGIVHRDLKPANILVTLLDGRPVPKVIDFGVAKATAGKLTDESLSTHFGAVVGTLEYMAPEQAGFSSEDIDTRADIYSLGVILYELLTGLRPIDAKHFRGAALTEMIRIIREEEPSKPSTRLSTDESLPSLAALRQTEPRKLMTTLRGDLDCVVMKCLEKSRDRRYETANSLARDIQRFLLDEAVEARPPSAGYRLGKFLKRNKGPALAAGLLLLALLGGVAGTTYGLFRAEAQRTRAVAAQEAEAAERARAVAERDRAIAAERQTAVERDKAVAAEAKSNAINAFLTQDLLTQAEPANNAAEDEVTLLTVLDRAAEKVGERFRNQPDLEADLRGVIARTYHGLGAWEKAEAQLRSVQEWVLKRDPESPDAYIVQVELAHILRHRGHGDAEVLRMAETASEALERLLGSDEPATLTALGHLASAYSAAGRNDEAIALLERVRYAKIAVLGPDHLSTLATLHNLGGAYLEAGKNPEAAALLERVRDARHDLLGPDHPDTLSTLNSLALAYAGAGNLPRAIELLERLRDAEIARLGPDHPGTLITLGNLARAYVSGGRLPEAIRLYERVRDGMIARLGPDHPNTLMTLVKLASAYRAAGRLPEAIGMLEHLSDANLAALGSDHPDTLSTLNDLAYAYQSAGKLREAIALFERVRDATIAKLGPDHPNTLRNLAKLASAYQSASRLPEAIALFERLRDARMAKLGPDHPDTLTTLNNLAVAYWKANQLDKSVPLFEDVLKRREARLGRQHPHTQGTIANLGVNYKDADRFDEAIPLLEEVYQASGGSSNLRWVSTPLLEAYAKAGRSSEAARLIQQNLADARKTFLENSPQLAGDLAQYGLLLLELKAYGDAEPLLRECLVIREKSQPEHWSTFNTKSMLGGALLGQQKYAEAEPLLLSGQEGMKAREATIPPQGKIRLTEAVERLVHLYEATEKPDEAARWTRERDAAKIKPPVGGENQL